MCLEIQTESFGDRLFCQVNRGFNDLIQASPYINYRADLFAAGLEDNPAVSLPLADKRRAFDEYRTKWDDFGPIQKEQMRKLGNYGGGSCNASGAGVFGFIADGERSIRFMTLESALRGIPQKVWQVSLPFELSPQRFTIYPQADVLAMAGQERR